MPRGILRTLRFGRAWLTGNARVDATEIPVAGPDRELPATLLLPRGRRRSLPGWVVLHGITRPGRGHPALQRFARTLAATRAAVLIPEVPEWRLLRLAPRPAQKVIEAAVRTLEGRREVRAGGVGLVGFSFGVSQALVASTSPPLRDRLRGVVGFGGYADIERTVRFQFLGEHEWKGESHRIRPDPYGRLVVGSNFLTQVPGYEDAGAVEEALRSVAAEAGDRQVDCRAPELASLRNTVRSSLSEDDREIFDVFLSPDDEIVDGTEVEGLVHGISRAARRHSSLLDPGAHLKELEVEVHLLHGRGDAMIPFTETLRLESLLPSRIPVRATITELFAHSGESPPQSTWEGLKEQLRLGVALKGLLGMV